MKTLILGANGQIAQWVVADSTDTNFVLTSKHAADGVTALDAADSKALIAAMQGVDVVYANLNDGGRTPRIARTIVHAMHETGVKRLIWIATIGIYDEISAANKDLVRLQLGTIHDENAYMGQQAMAAQIIEASDVNYTIIRPNELTSEPEIHPVIFQRDHEELRAGGPITRRSVAAYVRELIADPTLDVRASVAISE